MKFFYKAQTIEGEIIEGEAEAEDRSALIERMRAERKTLLFLEPIDKKEVAFFSRINGILSRVHLKEKVFFFENLSAMIGAGLPLTRSLSILMKQTKNPALKKILNELTASITAGSSFEGAMSKFPNTFPPLAVAMVKTGESSGSLPESLRIVGSYLEDVYILGKRIRGALIYPSIIILTMVVVGITMLIFVVPILRTTFLDLGVPLPFATSAIITTSDFLKNNGVLVLVVLVFVVAILFFAARTKKVKRLIDYVALKTPFLGGLVQKVNSARAMRTLASLLASGVTMLDAISITQDVVQNAYYKDALQHVREKIQKGVTLSEALKEREDLFPVLVPEMAAVGEETGKLGEMLLRVAQFYENEVAEITKNLSTIIEPVLMVLVGIGVGLFAYSMITPLYSVLGKI